MCDCFTECTKKKTNKAIVSNADAPKNHSELEEDAVIFWLAAV
jgi:hypothetical protein